MSTITSLCFYALSTVLFVSGKKYTAVINTASGPVRGLVLTTIENVKYAAFKGIPYAKPPLGYLRFKPPVEVEKWADVYKATTDSKVCTQANLLENTTSGSEDCLHINIYTPHINFNASISKPVMVWIYGGGFTVGDSSQSSFGPDYILGEDVILVTFNYRVGAFGFLNLQHENATGNAGLKDQTLALKWIKRNIAQFGGDPDKVTLFGQSAGAASTDYHALSDMSTGLFSRTISMSGSPLMFLWGSQRQDEALQQAFLLGEKLGIYTSSIDVLLKALYNASADEIATATITIDIFPFLPTIENPTIAMDQEKFLTECTPLKYASSNYTKVPHMMGFTSEEFVIFFRVGLGDIHPYISIAERALQRLGNLQLSVPFFANFNTILAKAKAEGIENLTHAALNQFIQNLSDLILYVGFDAKQKFMSRTNNHSIYYYRFSFVPANFLSETSSGIKLEGAGHADDQPYIFYMPSMGVPYNQSDVITTRRRIVKLWTNFARYGNPTPNGQNDELLGITWPDSRFDGIQLEIGANLSIANRQIRNDVEDLKLFGFGGSLYYNDCLNNKIM